MDFQAKMMDAQAPTTGFSSAAAAEIPVVRFEAAGKPFAVAVQSVLEVFRAVEITAAVGCPGIIEGVINLRGEIVPVVDLRTRLLLPAKPLSASDHFIAVKGRRTFVLRCDTCLEVTTIDTQSFVPADDLLPGGPYLAGVARGGDGLILIADPIAFLSQAESEAFEQYRAEMSRAGPSGR